MRKQVIGILMLVMFVGGIFMYFGWDAERFVHSLIGTAIVAWLYMAVKLINAGEKEEKEKDNVKKNRENSYVTENDYTEQRGRPIYYDDSGI